VSCGVEERASLYNTINTILVRRPWDSSSPINNPRRTMKSSLPMKYWEWDLISSYDVCFENQILQSDQCQLNLVPGHQSTASNISTHILLIN